MVIKLWKFRILIIIINLLLFSGCSIIQSTGSNVIKNILLKKPTIIPDLIFETGFLSGIPCSAPCILNSTPGVTNKEEVIVNLKKLNIFQNCTDEELNYEGGSVISCEPDLSFWFNDKNLSQVFIDNNMGLSIELVKNKYGAPQSVNIFREGTYQQDLTIYIVYDDYNFILLMNNPNSASNISNIFNITSDMSVNRILFEDEEEMNIFVDSCSIPWKGYGIYTLNSGC